MIKPLQLAIDLAVAAALAAALTLVYGLDRSAGRPETGDDPGTSGVAVREVEATKGPAAKALLLAVTNPPTQYDKIGGLLEKLGAGYKYKTIRLEDLEDYDKIAPFDVIFVTCGTQPNSWMGDAIGQGERPGTTAHVFSGAVIDRLKKNLRQFVGKGGTLYASDWQRPIVAVAFPEFFQDERHPRGLNQELIAEVLDAGLRDLIGPKLALRFDLAGWYPASLSGDKVQVLLQGEYRTMDGAKTTAPLLAKVPFEQGTIIFTSFHNEKQNSKAELQLLQHLVFDAVTAQTQAKVTKTMVSGGFSPRKQNLLSASADNPAVTKTYQNKKAGRLQFALGFDQRGARMRLTVTGPQTAPITREGTSTFTIDVSDAAVGEWQYTVTALEVPYPNFPFTLTVGEE